MPKPAIVRLNPPWKEADIAFPIGGVQSGYSGPEIVLGVQIYTLHRPIRNRPTAHICTTITVK